MSKHITALAVLSLGTFFVHGYHPWAEDAEIYLPGVEKVMHPALFPSFPEFFQFHAHLTLFPNLIALSVRFTHLPWEWVLFLWQFVSVFLLLLACWQLAACCFPDNGTRWAGVMLVAALLTLPVAVTALYVMDQYLNRRRVAYANPGSEELEKLLTARLRTAPTDVWCQLGFAAAAGYWRIAVPVS